VVSSAAIHIDVQFMCHLSIVLSIYCIQVWLCLAVLWNCAFDHIPATE